MKKLNIIKNNIIETQWLEIKTKFKSGNYDLTELDYLTSDLIAQLALLTVNGHTEVDGISIDKYKDRVWNVIENIGLLPEYRGEDDLFEKEITDDWEKVDEEDVMEINDEEFYK
jgi:hypothetical protein